MAGVSPRDLKQRTRRTMIDIARRRQRPGTGSRLQRQDVALRRWPDLSELLKGIPWAVVGGVATRNYMPERATQDLDVAILAGDAAVVADRLRSAGFVHSGPLHIGGDAWQAPDGTPLDVIEVREAWWPSALAAAADNLDQQGLPVLPLAYLVLMKLLSGRMVDLGDVGRMLGGASAANLESVRAVIVAHAPGLKDDLESMIELGQLEIEAGDEPR